jgi:ligand-binding sensor domain-containing protein/signal transduction histidine kinase
VALRVLRRSRYPAHGRHPPFLLVVSFFVTSTAVAWAERLPISVYTVADGLGSNHVSCVRRDSRGFMWFCTTDGLTRFDGERFVTYGVRDGLPHPAINDLLEERPGVYWVATNGGGVARFDTTARSSTALSAVGTRHRLRITTYSIGMQTWSNRVNVLYRDRAGRIWAGTDGGLFRRDRTAGNRSFRRIDLGVADLRDVEVRDLQEDQQGQLWVASSEGPIGVLSGDRLINYTDQMHTTDPYASALLVDRRGRVWVGAATGVWRFTAVPAATRADGATNPSYVVRRVKAGDIVSLHERTDGRVLVGGSDGLTEFTGSTFRTYTTAHGLLGSAGVAIGEDRFGNLWVGADDGLIRIARGGLVSYGSDDGLDPTSAAAFFETAAGNLGVVMTSLGSQLAEWQRGRFEVVQVNLGPNNRFGWGGSQLTLQDKTGEWWIPSERGLYRFAASSMQALQGARPRAVYTKADGLSGDLIFRLFEDSQGNIWIGTFSDERDRLTRWERASGRFQRFTEADGLRPYNAPTAFAEDAAGNVWVGFYEGGLARYRDGRMTLLGRDTGAPPGQVRALAIDGKGRLWVASAEAGLVVSERPDADTPRFVAYRNLEGLSSRAIYCLAEDRWGRLYVGSARGVDRLDPARGQWRHYTPAEGLPDAAVRTAFRDRQGALWFGTWRGVSRLLPEASEPVETPDVLISSVRVGGEPFQISDLGERSVTLPELPSNRNQIQIEFSALAFAPGRRIRYEYRLDGADEDWSPSTTERVVNYARLSPGRYRFIVRPMTTAGRVPPSSASVSFRILPPIWQRWWFLMLVAASAVFLAYAAHRYRVGQLLALERVRSRIATDLHDEVGSSLSQIAVLSEVARRRLSDGGDGAVEPLTRIADVSRESVDAMGEIVWAVDPERDNVLELEHRMRRFANDVLAARDIAVRFPASRTGEGVSADANIRRDVFLIFKEAVNNIVRHADATDVRIEFQIRRHTLMLAVSDNGKGLNGAEPSRGLGLRSMRERAKRLGGRLDVASQNGAGTRVGLTVPLTRRTARG